MINHGLQNPIKQVILVADISELIGKIHIIK